MLWTFPPKNYSKRFVPRECGNLYQINGHYVRAIEAAHWNGSRFVTGYTTEQAFALAQEYGRTLTKLAEYGILLPEYTILLTGKESGGEARKIIQLAAKEVEGKILEDVLMGPQDEEFHAGIAILLVLCSNLLSYYSSCYLSSQPICTDIASTFQYILHEKQAVLVDIDPRTVSLEHEGPMRYSNALVFELEVLLENIIFVKDNILEPDLKLSAESLEKTVREFIWKVKQV